LRITSERWRQREKGTIVRNDEYIQAVGKRQSNADRYIPSAATNPRVEATAIREGAENFILQLFVQTMGLRKL